MAVRGIRGATTAPSNTAHDILAATTQLLLALVQANEASVDDIASIYFTMTSDLDAAYPARAARELGWIATPLMDAQAPRVNGDVPHCIRVLIHWNTERTPIEIKHIYLQGARQLRPDLVRSSL
jgi:chorismate mutase